jgi:uncharacterized membrane protein
LVTTTMDQRWPDPRLWNGWLIFEGGASGARELLATLASSMMTVAGVVFSITIVVLTLAAAQLGPRLIPSFMGDTANQLVLGVFTATFIYCILVMRRVYGGDGGGYVPNISIMVGMLLAVLNSIVLIFYIHHIAVAIQSDQVINGVTRNMNKVIEKMTVGKGKPLSEKDENFLERSFAGQSRIVTVRAEKGGYVQTIDLEALKDLAAAVKGVFRLECRPGDFKLPGTPLLSAAVGDLQLPEDFSGRVCDLIVLGKLRTPEQDIEFSMEQLVEIALRALSPSLNDTFTAITCIDKLSSSLELFARAESPPYLYDDSGRVRLIVDRATFTGALDAAFNKVRQNGMSNPAVVIRLLERIADLLTLIEHPRQRQALLRHAELIKENSDKADLIEYDRQDIDVRYLKVMSLR